MRKPPNRAAPGRFFRSMRRISFSLAVALMLTWTGQSHADAQSPRPVDVASYQLQVRLDPEVKQVRGSGVITYQNPSDDTLSAVWLRLYLNAFRSPETLWLREVDGTYRGVAYDPQFPGWTRIERLALAGTRTPLAVEPGDADETIVRVPLPEPLPPGGRLDLDVEWTAQLPRVFARTGFAGDFFLAGQWYPKLAVYDRGRWDTEPWHANAEFFADFGSYNLALTVPERFVTGSSGVPLGETANGDGTKTVRYWADRRTDIVWTAWPHFRLVDRTVAAAGAPVQIELLLPAEELETAERHLTVAQAALDAFGTWYGPYPWPKLTLVVPPAGAEGAGGMEYPGLVTTGAGFDLPFGLDRGVLDVEQVTGHEIAHQWFPHQVQSNEAAEAWLDEGFADYLTARLLDRQYGPVRSGVNLSAGHVGYAAIHRISFQIGATRQPLAEPAWQYPSFAVYGATVYSKGSLALRTLERAIGDERFTRALRDYADRWRWRHPTTADLRAALEESTGESLDEFFRSFVSGDQVIDYRLGEIRGSHARVERLGAPGVSVEIRVTTADGAIRLDRWDGATETLEIAADQPITAVAIDPDERIAIELNRLNNARTVSPEAVPVLAVFGRWLALAQAWLQLTGPIG
ncbi:MAG TPA: M1 family metallopeptidase [Dehalococcoidia bacterium]|nr:M1 family metallopeptidase [Dehalococcoidia bacterium]